MENTKKTGIVSIAILMALSVFSFGGALSLSSKSPLSTEIVTEISKATNSLDTEEFKKRANGICCSETGAVNTSRGIYYPEVNSPSEEIKGIKFSGGLDPIAIDNSDGYRVRMFFHGNEYIRLRVRKSNQNDLEHYEVSGAVVGDKIIFSGGARYNRYGFGFYGEASGWMCLKHERDGIDAIPRNGYRTWTEGVVSKRATGCWRVDLFDDNKKAKGYKLGGSIAWSIRNRRDVCVTLGDLDAQANMTHWWVDTVYNPPANIYSPYVYDPPEHIYEYYVDPVDGVTKRRLLQAKGSISVTGHDLIKRKGADSIVWAHWEQGYRYTKDDHDLDGYGGMNAGTYCFKYILQRGNNLLQYNVDDRFDLGYRF